MKRDRKQEVEQSLSTQRYALAHEDDSTHPVSKGPAQPSHAPASPINTLSTATFVCDATRTRTPLPEPFLLRTPGSLPGCCCCWSPAACCLKRLGSLPSPLEDQAMVRRWMSATSNVLLPDPKGPDGVERKGVGMSLAQGWECEVRRCIVVGNNRAGSSNGIPHVPPESMHQPCQCTSADITHHVPGRLVAESNALPGFPLLPARHC